MKPFSIPLEAPERQPREGDVHVMPALPDDHPLAHKEAACWCKPWLNFVAENGSAVWVHREHGEA